MFKWYVIILVASVAGGWFAYPVALPVITERVQMGRLPEIDWSKLKPGQFSSAINSGNSLTKASEEAGVQALEPNDSRFDAVVMIEGSNHRSTGCIIERDGKHYIVTSQHALAGNNKLKIRDGNGREYRGKKMIAAKTADVAMIEIDSPPEGLASMAVAEDVAAVTRAKDDILVAGDGLEVGAIETRMGKLTTIGPVVLEVHMRVFPGLRGAPLYHPKSRSMVGVMAVAQQGSMGSNITGILADTWEHTENTQSLRYFGHRLDTITQWETLDWKSFQLTTAAIGQARRKLEMLSRFVSGQPGYAGLKELKAAERRASQMLANHSLSQRDREKAAEELLRIARSITSRSLNPVKKSKLYFAHRQDIKELTALTDEINKTITNAEKNIADFARDRAVWF